MTSRHWLACDARQRNSDRARFWQSEPRLDWRKVPPLTDPPGAVKKLGPMYLAGAAARRPRRYAPPPAMPGIEHETPVTGGKDQTQVLGDEYQPHARLTLKAQRRGAWTHDRLVSIRRI